MKQSTAFSLLEVLVSLAIFSLLMLILLEACHVGLFFCKKTEHYQESLRDAAAALQLITRDLEESVTMSHTPNLVVNTLTIDPTCRTNLFFLANIPPHARRANDLGSLHAVGYFLTAIPGSTEKGLYRFMPSSEATLEALAHDELLQLYQTACSKNTTDCECIANHVSDFSVTFHDVNQDKIFSSSTVEVAISINTQSSFDHRKNSSTEEESLKTIVALPPEKNISL